MVAITPNRTSARTSVGIARSLSAFEPHCLSRSALRRARWARATSISTARSAILAKTVTFSARIRRFRVRLKGIRACRYTTHHQSPTPSSTEHVPAKSTNVYLRPEFPPQSQNNLRGACPGFEPGFGFINKSLIATSTRNFGGLAVDAGLVSPFSLLLKHHGLDASCPLCQAYYFRLGVL